MLVVNMIMTLKNTYLLNQKSKKPTIIILWQPITASQWQLIVCQAVHRNVTEDRNVT